VYLKKLKKSIVFTNRLDIFLLIVIFLLAAIPVLLGVLFKEKKEIPEVVQTVNLYLSRQSGELLGMETTEKLIREFEEKTPGISILFADNSQQNDEQVHSPDILVFDDGNYGSLAAYDMLVEFNAFSNHESGSNQLAVPLVSFINLLFYNIDILSAAGFDSPPKTRDEFTAYARIVAGSNPGVSATALSLKQSDHYSLSRDVFSWIWAGGGNFWAEGDKPFLNTRLIANDIAFLDTLNREGMMAGGIFETTGDQRLNEFAGGRIAMMIASTKVIPYLRERMRDGAFGITAVPDANTGGRYSAGISSIYAGISADCKNISEARSFLNFLESKSSFICDELKAVPGIVANIIPGDYVMDDPYYSKAWEIFEFTQIAEDFKGKPNADEYEAAFLEELRIYFDSRTRTAQQTITAIQQRWDEIFEGSR